MLSFDPHSRSEAEMCLLHHHDHGYDGEKVRARPTSALALRRGEVHVDPEPGKEYGCLDDEVD